MRAFVTGICGFAGGYLAEHLLAAGDTVLGAARVARWPAGLGHLISRIELTAWDLAQPYATELREKLCEYRPTHVFHLAALDKVADCESNPRQAQEVNVGGTARLLELVGQLPVPPKVLLVSSSQVYKQDPGERGPVRETETPQPQSVYARTKLEAEKLAEQVKKRGISVVIVRPFNHTGPRQAREFLVPEWASKLVRSGSGEALCVQSLHTWLDLCDVRDVVRAYRMLASTGKAGRAYNVGSGQARRTGDILHDLMRLAGVQPPVVERTAGDHYRPIACLDRLQATVRWQAEIGWEQTLSEILTHWRTQPGTPQ